jgi:hypothetical protein
VKVSSSSAVGDPTDESVSERLVGECSGIDSGGELGLAGIEPEGSLCVMRGVVMKRGSPSTALLFASCHISKGVGIDCVRDGLVVF